MRNGKQSVFRDERRKWEPINRDAALVFKRATWEQMPVTVPRILPSPQEQAEAMRQAAAARYRALKAECDRIDRARAQQPKPKPEPKPRVAKLYLHAKNTLRAIHKRKGLPKPTANEVHAYAKTLPGYGQPA